MLSSEDRFNIIKQSIAGQIEGPAYEAIQAAEQESLQANTEEAPQSEQQTQIPQTPVGPPPAQTIPRVYDQLGSLIEPGSTGVGLNQMAGTSPGQTIQPGEYKTGGIKDGDPTKKWPALKNLGDFTVTSDSNFTQGYGNIEYFSPKQDTIRYELGNPETYRPHPNPGHHSVVYNPNKFDSQKEADQAIRLDLLHGMPEADPEYKKHYDEFNKAFKKRNKGDIAQAYKWAKSEGRTQDGKKAWESNYLDGTIRNLLYDGTDEEFSEAKYWPDARKVYLKDKNTRNAFSKLENYLETGYKNLLPQVDLIEKKKTGGPKSKAPKPLTESDAKLEEEWPLMLQKQRFVESGFNTNAKSEAGATGSAQIMPDTLDYAKMKGWVPETIGMKDLTGAEGYSISKHIQEKYMDNLFNRSWNKGTNEAKKAKALLAYNWGPENTRVKLNKLIDQGVNVWDNTDFTKYFNEESRQYKGKILDDLTTKKDPYVQRDYKKLKDLSPLLRMHGGPKVLYNNKKLKK